MKRYYVTVVAFFILVMGSPVAMAQDSIPVGFSMKQDGRKVVVRVGIPISLGEGSFTYDLVCEKDIADIQALVIQNRASEKQWIAPNRLGVVEKLKVGEENLVHIASFKVEKGYRLRQINFATTDQKYKFSFLVEDPSQLALQMVNPDASIVPPEVTKGGVIKRISLKAWVTPVDVDDDGFRVVEKVEADSVFVRLLSDYDSDEKARPDQLICVPYSRPDGSNDWNCDGKEDLEFARLGGFMDYLTGRFQLGVIGWNTIPPYNIVFHVVFIPPGIGVAQEGWAVQAGI